VEDISSASINTKRGGYQLCRDKCEKMRISALQRLYKNERISALQG
jgi:hypothetical protein